MLHHEYGPSTLPYLKVCAGYKKDPSSNSEAAKRGVAQHLAMECLILGKPDSVPPLDEWERKNVDKCLAYASSLLKVAESVEVEQKLVVLDGLTFGTGDLLVRRMVNKRPHLDVVDWKFGRNPVDDADQNAQGWAYAIGGLDRWPDSETVKVHFLMPNLDTVFSHVFTRDEVRGRLSSGVARIIGKAEEFKKTGNEKLLNRVDIVCARCGRIGVCPKFTELAIAATNKYAPLEVPIEMHCSSITDPAQAAVVLPVVQAMEKWVDAAKRHLTQLGLENGGLHDKDGKPVYKIVERAGSTSISNPTLAYPILRAYLETEEIAHASDISLTKVMEQISAKAPKGMKGKMVAQVMTELSDAGALKTGNASHSLKRIAG